MNCLLGSNACHGFCCRILVRKMPPASATTIPSVKAFLASLWSYCLYLNFGLINISEENALFLDCPRKRDDAAEDVRRMTARTMHFSHREISATNISLLSVDPLIGNSILVIVYCISRDDKPHITPFRCFYFRSTQYSGCRNFISTVSYYNF